MKVSFYRSFTDTEIRGAQDLSPQSDHPVVNSRYLLFEAQQAHYYGLHPALALASVTSVPARAAGLSHRVGTIAEGTQSFDS